MHCSIAAQSRSMSGSSATIFDSTVCSVQRVMPLKEVCGRGGGVVEGGVTGHNVGSGGMTYHALGIGELVNPSEKTCFNDMPIQKELCAHQLFQLRWTLRGLFCSQPRQACEQ